MSPKMKSLLCDMKKFILRYETQMTKHQKMYFAIWDTYRTLNIVYIMAKPKMSTASTNSQRRDCHYGTRTDIPPFSHGT